MTRERDVHNLPAWQLAHELNLRVELFLGCPDFRQHFKNCDELREAARSGPLKIAEGHAQPVESQFADLVRAARGSEEQVLQLLRDARKQRLISADELDINNWLARRAIKAATTLIRRLQATS